MVKLQNLIAKNGEVKAVFLQKKKRRKKKGCPHMHEADADGVKTEGLQMLWFSSAHESMLTGFAGPN